MKNRKLPPGVADLAKAREKREDAKRKKRAREFLALPEDERRRQLIEMLGFKVTIDGETVAEKKAGRRAPANAPASE